MHIAEIQKSLILAIKSALKRISPETLRSPVSIVLEVTKDPRYGDFTTNIAMRLAKAFSTSGVGLAGLIKNELEPLIKTGKVTRYIEKIEVSPPGFLNFRFSNDYHYFVLSEACKEKESFGKGKPGKREAVNIEFVSANPTGPLTIAHGRQAAVGDALARILQFAGHDVTREYFVNDVGNQIALLGRSIHSRYLSLNGRDTGFPKDGYQGEYIKKIAEDINKKYQKRFIEDLPKNLKFLAEFGVKTILKTIEDDLEKFGVHFNKWFSQRKLTDEKIKNALERLRAKGYVYDKDGATWFRSTAFKDAKDRVVIKSDGAFTYLAPDIAYHLEKYKRGFHRLINIWGPDHHGYIPRLTASMEAFGHDRETISVRIVQLATLLRDGEVLSMSTRKGEFVTLREVINEVGCDVSKFFFLMRKLDSHLDFDLEVAKKSSLDNPVYYIQYAHARISSIFGFSRKHEGELKSVGYDPKRLSQPEEIGLLRMLGQFPLAVEAAARTLEPYKLIEFLNELAKAFHRFYTKHKVVSEEDLALTKARLKLVGGIKIVLANGLNLLGISFPERM